MIGGVSTTRFILAGRADVGELLALDDVELEVIAARVLADDHAGIDLGAVLDEHRARGPAG